MELDRLQDMLKDLAIPPRPEAITRMFAELSKDEPELVNVARIVQSDAAITAGVLQVANSPLLGLKRKVGSIPQALSLLGMRNVANIATGIAIRQSLKGGGDGKAFTAFWDSAEKTALICSYLAGRLRGIPADIAFTYGLFHDCGVPLLLERFPHYKDVLRKARVSPGAIFTALEEDSTGTSHAILGYFLSRSWSLPDDLCQAILLHHDREAFTDRHTPEAVRNLIGLIHLAEHIERVLLGNSGDSDWDDFGTDVERHFGLTDEDVANLTDAIGEAMHLTE